jgi:hypothetical protein
MKEKAQVFEKLSQTGNARNLFSEHYLTCSWMNHGNTWLEHMKG